MKIASLNSNSPQTSFRSAFPVVHWIAETNGSYTPADMQTVRLLQGKVIRILNKPLSKTTKPIKPQEQAIKAYMGSCDADYRHKAVARSFYKYTSGNPEKYTPVSFIITGKDVDLFNNSYGRNIGEAKGKARANGHKNSSEVDDAIRDYKYDGFAFVKADKRQIKDKKGLKYILHTKFEIVRNEIGKIKDYRFVDARFLPASGPRNPLNKLG